MGNTDQKYTWVQTHKELAQYLKNKEEDQEELVGLLREAGVDQGLVDEYPEGKRFDLEEIDPFSFFCFIYKYGPEKRLKVLQHLAEKLDLHYPEDESGIPSAQAQKVMMFPFKFHRNDDEIKRLWDFFDSVLDGTVTDQKFKDTLNIYGVGIVKITEALFYVDPETYLPINGPTKPYLKQVLGINPEFSTWQEYLETLSRVKEKSDLSFYELSYEAWAWNEERKKRDKKHEAFKELIELYKQYLKEDGLDQEQYKWEAIHHFQQTFDIEADDFTDNFKTATSKAANLVYQNSIGFIRKAVQYYPEEVRKMFEELYDESKPLQERTEAFIEGAEDLLPGVVEKHGKKLSHQQDERTICYYLTMRYPDIYPLYKNETYQYLLSVLGIQESKPAGEKLFHYLELAEELIPAIESDGDVIDMVEDLLTEECYQGEQKWLVFQDVLWINMRSIDPVNYWVFQCNPAKFDVISELEKGELSDWTVDSHKDKIKEGDKVILWVTGKQAGCYALCETTSGVYEDTIEVSHKGGEEQLTNRIDMKVTHNLVNSPILKPDIDQDDRLSDLNVGHQGTNFTATQEEYEAIIELAEGAGDDKWLDLLKIVKKINHDEAIRKYFNVLAYVLNALESDGTEETIYASSLDKRIQLTLGSRYVSRIGIMKGEVKIGYYIYQKHLDALENQYSNLEVSDTVKDVDGEDMLWIDVPADAVNVADFYESTLSVAKTGFFGQSKSQFRSIYSDKHNPWIAKVALNDDLLDKLLKGEKMPSTKNKPEVNYPLNTIFYGPPGTGKTYTTIKRAAEIVEGREIDDYDEAKRIFNQHLGEEIEFITFHQNYSYEDFIEGLRPDIENNNDLLFRRSTGIFKELAQKAEKNYKASKGPQTKKKTFETVYNEFISPLIEGDVEEIEVQMKRVSFHITDVTDRFIDFRKASGGTAHSLNIDKLKKMYEEESVEIISGLKSYYTPLLDKLLDMGKTPGKTETIPRKNYVLIIDEINRANISRVFGELITLIEPDKRYGREMHIPAKLPSGEEFSVPENLYIIGTMNTADKSIALLDIALRRRFEFEAMYPQYKIDGEKIHDVDVLRKINDRIKELKGHDFQIGHSYFMTNHMTLKQRMNRRVIPLLLEYFMNDEKEVKQILKHADLNVKKDSWPLEITGRA